ncbi:MAG: DUF3854 domain-containing protein [Symplocastrum torsivum CPER-KK1]|jgi:hypothetical protein|uniref:DUF3854 domain-containing protein n=1 Tax=Symplocastrum torsivum CPER-KK1 TaxID=450513 RepID=A0A951PTT9_9CYAN|nr:DUF3854 domain-containing protein [Symplocastrum torsivum CPER-KK1]
MNSDNFDNTIPTDSLTRSSSTTSTSAFTNVVQECTSEPSFNNVGAGLPATSTTQPPDRLRENSSELIVRFQERTRHEWTQESGVSLGLFHSTVELVADTESEAGGEVRYPIHEALNWHVVRFGRQARATEYAAIIYTLDPEDDWAKVPFQVKLAHPRFDSHKGKVRKYENPVGTGRVLGGFVPVTDEIWQQVSQRYEVPLTDEDRQWGFWNWVINHPEIPIFITEGMKKAGCLLSLGYVALALSGITMGAFNPDGQGKQLRPFLAPFATSGRTIYIVFDAETKPKTIQAVRRESKKLGGLLAQAGCLVWLVKLPQLPGVDKTGVDDFIVACGEGGAAAVESLLKQAVSLNRYCRQERLTLEPALCLNERFLPDFPLPTQGGLIGIKARKGGGKTEWLSRLLQQYPGAKVLNLGHLVSLLRSLSLRLGTKMYSECKSQLERVQRLSCTLDSLWKIATEGNRYDFVILDEVEQILKCLCTKEGRNFKENHHLLLQVFSYFIRTARYVIALDANLSNITLNYLSKLREGEKPFLVENRYQGQGRKIYWYEGSNHTALNDTMVRMLLNGQNFIVSSDSLNFCKTLEQDLRKAFPELPILTIHGENSGEVLQQAFLKDPNEESKKYRVVCYSPSLVSGVDICDFHFHARFGLYFGGTQEATECAQSFSRYRPSEEVENHIWVNPRLRGGYKPTNPTQIRLSLLQNNQATAKLLIHINPETGARGVEDDNYLELWSELLARHHFSLNNLRVDLALLLEDEGHTLIRMEGYNNQQTQKRWQESREQVLLMNAQAIAQAQDISEVEAEALEFRADRLNLEERQQLEHYYIKDFYGRSPDVELVCQDNKGRWRSQLIQLELALAPAEVVLDRDARERERFKVCTDWKNYSLRRLVRQRIGLLEIVQGLLENPQREFHPDDPELVALSQCCQTYAGVIKSVLNVTFKPDASPIWILGVLLEQLGLKLKLLYRRGRRGHQVRVYGLDLEVWDFAMSVLNYRQHKREQAPQNQSFNPLTSQTAVVVIPPLNMKTGSLKEGETTQQISLFESGSIGKSYLSSEQNTDT